MSSSMHLGKDNMPTDSHGVLDLWRLLEIEGTFWFPTPPASSVTEWGTNGMGDVPNL